MINQHREIVAYQGQCFAIEWYYTERGDSEALHYYRQLSADRRHKVLSLFRRLGETGAIFDTTKFRHEGDHIYAFKPQPDRFLCFFFTGKKIIITNAFMKKTDKLPQREKKRALRHREHYEQRVLNNTYYVKS